MGPLTNENRTHCYSTHLTTFASGLVSMPAPQQWNDLVSNDEMREEHNIGVMMVCVLFVSIAMLICSIDEQQDAREVSDRRSSVGDANDGDCLSRWNERCCLDGVFSYQQ